MDNIPPHDFMGAPWPPPESDQLLIDTIPPHLKLTTTFKYDAELYPFRKIVSSIVCPDHPVEQLEKLHEGSEFAERRIGNKSANQPQHGGRTIFSKRWRSREKACPELHAGFRKTLGLFVENVITPLLYADQDDVDITTSPPTLFQRSPTFRAHMPGTDRGEASVASRSIVSRPPLSLN